MIAARAIDDAMRRERILGGRREGALLEYDKRCDVVQHIRCSQAGKEGGNRRRKQENLVMEAC